MVVEFRCERIGHGEAFTARKQANGKYAVYKGSKPLKKDISSLPQAVLYIIDTMGFYKDVGR